MSDAAEVGREFLECWNRRDLARMRDMMHAEYTYIGGDGVELKGGDAGMEQPEMFAAAFPDGRLEDLRVYDAGNGVVFMEFVGRGTHTGDLMGIAPTGRRIEIRVCDVVEIRDGKIFAEREYMDMMAMMQQLGVVPAPTTAG